MYTTNLRGKWVYAVRHTDEQGLPFDDIKFRLE